MRPMAGFLSGRLTNALITKAMAFLPPNQQLTSWA